MNSAAASHVSTAIDNLAGSNFNHIFPLELYSALPAESEGLFKYQRCAYGDLIQQAKTRTHEHKASHSRTPV